MYTKANYNLKRIDLSKILNKDRFPSNILKRFSCNFVRFFLGVLKLPIPKLLPKINNKWNGYSLDWMII